MISKVFECEVTVPEGFQVEVHANVRWPVVLALAPPTGPFGENLYVASAYLSEPIGLGLPDSVMRVSPDGVTHHFAQLSHAYPAEPDPVALEFASGAGFGTDLYVSCNNLDFGQDWDKGGSILRIDHAGAVSFLTPSAPPCIVGEPCAFDFGRGGSFGTDLFLANSSDFPYDITTITPAGQIGTYKVNAGYVPFEAEFGPGGDFTSNLYFHDYYLDAILTADASGGVSEFVSLPFRPGDLEFSPGGPFGTDLYVYAKLEDECSIFRIHPDGSYEKFAGGLSGMTMAVGGRCPQQDGLEFSPDGNELFVADYDRNTVWRITAGRPMTVHVDLKPQSCPNPFNPESQGVLPVAILGTTDFDITDIDQSSVRLKAEGSGGMAVRSIPNLSSIVFWEVTGTWHSHEFGKEGSQLTTRLPDPLGYSNVDFWGVYGREPYDVFYSDGDGSYNLDGKYVTVEATFDRGLPAGGGLNIAEVELKFTDGSTERATSVASFVAMGDNAIPGWADRAADGDPSSFTEMGNTVGTSERLRVTVGFKYSTGAIEQSVAPLRTDIEDVTVPVDNEDVCDCETEWEGPDGYDDLTAKFDIQEIVQILGPVSDGDVVILTIIGKLTDGTPFEGQDCVVIRYKGGPQSWRMSSLHAHHPVLLQNSPNPFQHSTSVLFTLPKTMHTAVTIHDVTGRVLATIMNEKLQSGYHALKWNCDVPSGTYFCRLQAGRFTETRRMTVIR